MSKPHPLWLCNNLNIMQGYSITTMKTIQHTKGDNKFVKV